MKHSDDRKYHLDSLSFWKGGGTRGQVVPGTHEEPCLGRRLGSHDPLCIHFIAWLMTSSYYIFLSHTHNSFNFACLWFSCIQRKFNYVKIKKRKITFRKKRRQSMTGCWNAQCNPCTHVRENPGRH